MIFINSVHDENTINGTKTRLLSLLETRPHSPTRYTPIYQRHHPSIQAPDYRDFIINPMDLGTIEKNIQCKSYGSTEAFTADVKWILHNCIIYNGSSNKLTTIAKQVLKFSRFLILTGNVNVDYVNVER